MMKETYLKDFKRRLDEAGVKYEMTELETGRVKIEVPFKTRHSDEQWNCHTLAVQGLIYHFSNRKWIIDDNYTYIMQNVHVIEFNTEKVE